MFTSDPNKEWERFGKSDPYFGVVTNEKYRNSNLTEGNKEEFFNSGRDHINLVLRNVARYVDSDFKINNALDFGCGVGRLLIPLAGIAQQVTGVDVSKSMLAEAKKNCDSRSINNVTLASSDDSLTLLDGKFNFVHSYIVFQHIPVTRGEVILKRLLELLENDGIGVLHFTYAKEYVIKKFSSFFRNYVPIAGRLINLAKGRGFLAPDMQMNSYDLNRIFLAIQQSNVKQLHAEFTDHDGEMGVVLYFKKSAPTNEKTSRTHPI